MMMAKKNSDYWNKRFANLENEQYKNGAEHYKEIENLFRKTNSDIEMEISKWYMRIEDNNEISLNKAKQLLKKDELKEFQWNVRDYIKFGKENAINLQWMKELENASAKVHISRLEAIKLQLQQHIEMLFSKYNSSTNDFLNKSFKNQYYHTAFEIAKGTGIGTSLNKIDLNNINTVLSRPWSSDGSNFSDRIWTNKQKLINNLNTELTQNIIRGSDPKQAIDSLAKQMLVSKNQAATLVMTESAAISSKAQQQCFKDLDVEKYEIVSTLDTHTSNICRDLDGKVFDMKDYAVGSTAPPFHPNCRTVTVPYFEDLGGERASRGVDGKTQYVENMKYDEWYEKYVSSDDKYKYKETIEKNRDSDKQQYESYIKVLGKKYVPKNLKEFQDIKYQNSDEYDILKAQVKGMSYYNKAVDNEPLIHTMVLIPLYKHQMDKSLKFNIIRKKVIV